MYNKEFKERYLKEANIKEYSKMCVRHEFDNIESYEELLDKDCSNFTLKEIMTYYKLTASASVKTLTVLNSYFRNYTTFAIKNNFVTEGINHYEELDVALIMKCVNSGRLANKIYSRAELYELLDELDFIASEQCILLGAFEGVEADELIAIKAADVTDGMLTLNSGRVIPISSKFAGLIDLAANEYEYDAYNSLGRTRVYKFDESDSTIIKVRVRKDTDLNKIIVAKKKRISKFMYRLTHIKTNLPITYTSLRDSGCIDMINSIPAEENEDTYNKILRNKDLIAKKYTYIKNTKNYMIEYGDYLM